MRVPRIHLPPPLAEGAVVALDEAAFNHAVRVLRLRTGASLTLFDGTGGEFCAVLETVERRRALVRIGAFVLREAESALRVVLAQGVSKGERMDYALQKAVELGVAAVQPLLTARSAVNLDGERRSRRLGHWRRIVAGACEQCGRNRLPEVREPLPLEAWLQTWRCGDPALLLDPQAPQRLTTLAPPEAPLTLLIGPEGGLSPGENAAARARGFVGVCLGPRVLRTETAAVAALAALQLLWGDLG